MKKAQATQIEGAGDYWSRLSDAELLTISFTTEDPESLPGLVHELPAITSRPIVEYAYNFRGTKRALIRCAHCKYPNHREGFVIKLDDDTRFLCGHDCGKKIYGVDFDTLRSDFMMARSRKLSLIRIGKLRELLPAFNAYIFGLRTGVGVSLFKDVKSGFRRTIPRLHGALEIVTIQHNLQLQLQRRVRDYSAENRAQDQYDKDLAAYNSTDERERSKRNTRPPRLPQKQIFTMENYLFGSIPTPTLFTERCFKKVDFDALASRFVALENAGSGDYESGRVYKYRGHADETHQNKSDRMARTDGDIDRTLMDANTLLNKLDHMLEQYEEMASLFDFPVLSLIADWATKRSDIPGTFKAVSGGLIYVNEDGDEVSVRLPADFQAPDRGPLKSFRDAISSSS